MNKARSFVLCCCDTHLKWCENTKLVSGHERRLSSSTSDEDLGRKLRAPHLRSQHLRTCLQRRREVQMSNTSSGMKTAFCFLFFFFNTLNSPCADGSRYGSLRKSRAGWCESLLKRVHRGEVRGCVGGHVQRLKQPEP